MTRVTLAQDTIQKPRPFSKDVRAKLYPNGEIAIYQERKFKPKPPKRKQGEDTDGLFFWLNHAFGTTLGQAVAWVRAMGLAQVANFDRNSEPCVERDSGDRRVSAPYGRRGITRYGARRVRCACHLLHRAGGQWRVVMATVTVPPLPREQMARLHQSWNHVVDSYRRKVSRALRQKGLSGEIVSVTEIQEERYQKTGVPVLHIHAIFIGKTAGGQWAITTEDHDDIWRSTLSVCLGEPVGHVGTAGRLERVKHSAEGYLGKYMTKGSKAVNRMLNDGFTGWIPKQWWSCTRTLSRRIDYETRDISSLAEWLNSVADVKGADVWRFHRDVFLEFDDGRKYRIARYGRLNKCITAEIQASLPPVKMVDMAY